MNTVNIFVENACVWRLALTCIKDHKYLHAELSGDNLSAFMAVQSHMVNFSNPRYPGLNLQESPGGRVLDAQRGHLIKAAMRELLKKVGWIPSRG